MLGHFRAIQWTDTHADRLAKSILAASLANGITAIAVIVGMAFWMASQIDALSKDNSRRLFLSALQAEMEGVAISTQDYGNWDLAYEQVVARNDDEFDVNFGSGATEGPTFDFIYVLEPDGTPVYAYETDGEGSDITLMNQQLAESILPLLSALPVEPYQTISQYARVGDQLAVTAAGRIQPVETDGLSKGDIPLMIGGKWLSVEHLAEIGEQLLVSNVVLQLGDEPKMNQEAEIILKAADNQVIGHVGWSPSQQGRQLLGAALPVILALSGLTLFATLFVGRAAAQQTSAFLQQKQIARTDPLTGLINRAGLDALLSTAPVTRAIETGDIAVVYLDLNGFKRLNDHHGHDAGDSALQIIAERIGRAVRAEDHAIRLGGDEFLCVLIDRDARQAADHVVDRIITATEPPIQIGDISYVLRPSIGIALGGPDLGWGQLLKNADRAMYRAKMTGVHLPVFHAENMQSSRAHTAA